MGRRYLWGMLLFGVLGPVAIDADASELQPPEQAVAAALNRFDLAAAARLTAEYEADGGPDYWSQYFHARIAILRGDLAAAERIAGACVGDNPEVSRCHEVSGESALVGLVVEGNPFKQMGAARTARKSLEQAVALDPDNLRARLLLVRFYSLAPWFAGGSASKASAQARACATRDAYSGHAAQALLALAQQRYEDAISDFAAARALRPDDRGPTYYLARAYVGAGQTEAATELLEELVDRYPRFHEAWLELGRVAAARGLPSPRGTAALEYYLQNATEASAEKRAEAAVALSELHLAAGRITEAARMLALALDLQPDSGEIRRTARSFCGSHPDSCTDGSIVAESA